ncbi:MAG: ribosomal protein S18-alanine N-acetyltransferase [SAR324 cluster bacterium]|nr:ribosomal protein S18-alanine N-acetyltransferase [SAR324 cluster bacterium]MBL7035757.1 ribosomal protein S18-alanine N-acetyltransferase [SAR324 cluster bacterium]
MKLSLTQYNHDLRFSLNPSPSEMMEMDSLCFSGSWSEQDYQEMQAQPTYRNWLLKLPGAGQVGMLVFQSVPPELQILRLAVHPEWRGKGLAVFMLDKLEMQAKMDNLESLWLEVHSANKPARALYFKEGFQQISCRKNYYQRPPGDSFLLIKLLKQC